MPSLDTPAAIGPYRLGRELGRGAFGVVYEAAHEDRPDTRLAVKTVEAQGNVDRLLVEPALLARLKHPCIVGLEDYFVDGGKLVLAMEFVPGEDLKARIDHGEPFSPEQVFDFLTQMASALAEAHSQQIVHRDIKPSNILIDTTAGRPRFVLTDFGIGRRAEGLQAEKHVGGTYLYMAPEQLRGRPGPQSDLWALGVVAYQMLTGKLPFPGPSLGELSKQIHYDDPPPPSAVLGRPLPGALEDAVVRLLKKPLAERFGSAVELLRHLGVRGDTKQVFDTTITRRTHIRRSLPLAQKLARDVKRATTLLAVMVAIYVVINGVVEGILFLAGLWLFFRGQSGTGSWRRRTGLTALAFLVLTPRLLKTFSPTVQNWLLLGMAKYVPGLDRWVKGILSELGMFGMTILSLAAVFLVLLGIFVPVIGSAAYANRRRAKREQTLIGVALAGRAGSDEFLTLMRGMLDNRFEDVSFHLRYAELLFARGDYRRAAVEARLVTVQDPYHFNANLLLANAYYALGLYEDCRAVCADYLAVTGYGFEFLELRSQCDTRLSHP